jgi:hypothetical protein
MKNSIRLLLGSLLLIPICLASSATGVSQKSTKPDTYQYGFGYTITPDAIPNVFDITLYFLKLDVTNFTWAVADCPSSITVTCLYGPRIGSITFVPGESSVGLGNTTDVIGTEYTISTDPTTLDGLVVYQEAFEIEM